MAGAEHEMALRCIATKQQIVAELISGRLPLVEATARFRSAGGAAPPAGPVGPEPAGEELCRTVIGWAHLALSDRPERAEAVSATLERELQTHLTRHGSVRLPY
jgi:hypothetical protein